MGDQNDRAWSYSGGFAVCMATHVSNATYASTGKGSCEICGSACSSEAKPIIPAVLSRKPSRVFQPAGSAREPTSSTKNVQKVVRLFVFAHFKCPPSACVGAEREENRVQERNAIQFGADCQRTGQHRGWSADCRLGAKGKIGDQDLTGRRNSTGVSNRTNYRR